MATTVQTHFTFKEEYTVGEFMLTIRHLEGAEADQLAAQIRRYIETAFRKANPLLCTLYDFEIDETEVWTGSRKSKNRGKLKKKKGKTIKEKLGLLLSRLALGLSLAATDPTVIQENWERVVQSVENVFGTEPPEVEIEELETFPLEADLENP